MLLITRNEPKRRHSKPAWSLVAINKPKSVYIGINFATDL